MITPATEFHLVAGLSELVVMDTRNSSYSQDIMKWREGKPVAMPQSCDRQLWFFSQLEFQTFPESSKTDPRIKLYFGEEAYRHLLQVVTGVDSQNLGETNIAGQFNLGWAKFCKDHPLDAKKFDRIVQSLWTDSALIRTHIISSIKSKRHEMVARYLTGFQGGETVLLVGDVNPDGSLAHATGYIARAIANNRSSTVSEIIVTNPNETVTDKLYDGLLELEKRNVIRCGVSQVPFAELSIAVEVSDVVYVATPMQQDRQADQAIIDTWQGRQRRSNQIIHLRGDPLGNMGYSTTEWLNAGLDNYIPVERIREHAIEIEEKNGFLTVLAKEATEYCAHCRSQGQRPDKKLFAELAATDKQRRDQILARAAFGGTIKYTKE